MVERRATIFPIAQASAIIGLIISPIGMVEEKMKSRIVHDMPFKGTDTWGEKTGVTECNNRMEFNSLINNAKRYARFLKGISGI